MSMRDKYQRSLEHILSIPKDSNGLFSINYKESAALLGLTISTLNRHIKKFIEQQKLSIVYKGGSVLPSVCKRIIMDADKYNDGFWQTKRNPNNYLSTVYSTHVINQCDRDMVILRKVLGWQESYLRHYQWWSNALSLKYDENKNGLSQTTIELLSQFVKYVVDCRFGYDDECYDEYMNCFVSIENAHGISM